MSYDVALKDPKTGRTIEVPEKHSIRGGTYAAGGTNELWLNVTYNYGHIYRRPDVLGDNGIRTIYGMTGRESVPVLQKAINTLGDNTNPDYWMATDGNAKAPLQQLLEMANMRPDGIWDGD